MQGEKHAIDRTERSMPFSDRAKVGRRVDIEADNFPTLVCEFQLVGALERAHPMGLQHVPFPAA